MQNLKKENCKTCFCDIIIADNVAYFSLSGNRIFGYEMAKMNKKDNYSLLS